MKPGIIWPVVKYAPNSAMKPNIANLPFSFSATIFSFSTRFWFFDDFSETKNNEYKTITAEDNAMAAIVFLESIIFLLLCELYPEIKNLSGYTGQTKIYQARIHIFSA